MLEDARQHPDDKTTLTQALRFNHRLWTLIQADITEPASTLPAEVKANMMSLSIFVDKQTTWALRTGAAEEVDILVAINRCLAMGLAP
ncbi:flagellar biosynthesis regulator FlaF [Pararhodospirillum photometricum]|nr:flagellar biosynthesis regulator FlaF [Pararhodospirillum photometricum]